MIKMPNFWYEKTLISFLLAIILYPISLIWILVNNIKKKFTFRYQSKITVICVGNINLGGSGKTPFCIFLFNFLKLSGYNPVFLTRGYKSKINNTVQVNLSKKDKLFYGDEAIILAKNGPTIISKNRLLGVKFIENHKSGFNIIIMDDGLQNYTIYKDLNFLALDKVRLFGNKFCFPSGPLRETINSCVNQTDAIILTGNKNDKPSNFKIDKPIHVFDTYIQPNLKNINLNQNYFAFCAIGNDRKFYNTLKLFNFRITKFKSFANHLQYSNKQIESLIFIANKNKLRLITTEKDYVKISKKYHKYIDVLKIKIEISKKDKARFKSFINGKVKI